MLFVVIDGAVDVFGEISLVVVVVVVVVFVFVVVAIVVEMQFSSKLVNKFREKHAKLFCSLTTVKYNCCVNICSGKNCNDDEPTNKTKRS